MTTPSRDYSGTSVIVTGGSSLIGEAIARVFLDRGAAVVIADVKVSEGTSLARDLGRGCEFVATDLRLDDDIDRAVGIATALAPIKTVVNNAAIFIDHQLETDRATWLDAFNVNVVAASILVQRCRDQLAETKGSVVNIGSISARVSQPGRLVYNTTKAAMLQMTKNLAHELAADGVRVNSVSPGWTWSRNIEARYDDRAHADRFAAEFQPLGRMGDPEEIAAAVFFLASDDASFITGSDLKVDGGYGALGPEALGQAAIKIPPV